MSIKLPSWLFRRFFFLLALLLLSAGRDGFAQQNFTAPVAVSDSIMGENPHTISQEEAEDAAINGSDSTEDKLIPTTSRDSIKMAVSKVQADTSDSTEGNRELIINLGGREGWRIMTAPKRSVSFEKFLDPVWVQGVANSDNPITTVPTILSWSESNQGFTQKPADISSTMEIGKGYVMYFFADDNPSESGIQGGFPKKLKVRGTDIIDPVSVKVTAHDANDNGHIDSDEGWNLMGNPFNEELSVEKVKSVFKAAGDSLNEYVYVWNRTIDSEYRKFEALGAGDVIAPFQAFFVKYEGNEEVNGTVSLRRTELVETSSPSAYGELAEQEFSFALQISNGKNVDTYEMAFSSKGSMLLNRFDAYNLFSLDGQSLNLYGQKGDGNLQKNMLPVELNSAIEIPIHYEHEGEGELIISWENIKTLPHGWSLSLFDANRNTEIDLRTNTEYHFFHGKEPGHPTEIPEKVERPHIFRDNESGETGRFILSISPKSSKTKVTEGPESIKLKPNYPNPFNQETTISYELTEEREVTLSIWNMIGQKVATLVDDFVEAGSHEERWVASQMPSGMYIARLEVGTQVFTRKMTLIK